MPTTRELWKREGREGQKDEFFIKVIDEDGTVVRNQSHFNSKCVLIDERLYPDHEEYLPTENPQDDKYLQYRIGVYRFQIQHGISVTKIPTPAFITPETQGAESTATQDQESKKNQEETKTNEEVASSGINAQQNKEIAPPAPAAQPNNEAASLGPSAQESAPIAALKFNAQPSEETAKAILKMDAESNDKDEYAGHIPKDKYDACMNHEKLNPFKDHKDNIKFRSNKEDKVGQQEEHIGKIDILVRGKTTYAEATAIAKAIHATSILKDPTFTVEATDREAAIELAKQCEKDGIPLSRIIVNGVAYKGPEEIKKFLGHKSPDLAGQLQQAEEHLNPAPGEIHGPSASTPASAPAPVIHSHHPSNEPPRPENLKETQEEKKTQEEQKTQGDKPEETSDTPSSNTPSRGAQSSP